MKNLIYNELTLKALELNCYLGWGDTERECLQKIYLDAHIAFKKPLKACETDDLNDTYCYAKMVKHIKEKVANVQFKLIEHLAYTIYQILKSLLPIDTSINIRLKKKPLIENLTGGVIFSYGDEKTIW